MELLRRSTGKRTSEIISSLAGKPEFYANAEMVIRREFESRLSRISISEVLAQLLRSEKGRKDTLARIRQVVISCQPMWQADPGQINVGFNDTMIIGLPRTTDPDDYQLMRKTLEDAGARQINSNGQYRAVAQLVDVSDLSRVYVLRLTVGACWDYLREMRQAERSYLEWNKQGAHSVHIFNAATVAAMPSLFPVMNGR
jgi:hypothetical protein